MSSQENPSVLLLFRGKIDEVHWIRRETLVQDLMKSAESVAVRNFDDNLASDGKKYDLIRSGDLDSEKQVISDEKALEISKILNPNGKLQIKKSGNEDCTIQATISNLKLAGFVDIIETMDAIEASVPSYVTGSKVQLSFAAAPSSQSNGQKVWQLDDAEEEMIDDNELLDEDDLKKPDPASLKVCASTGKRKACTNCSCGLADELENEALDKIKQNSQNAKSSCGSCYLGDAFRCASCPYLGMPAFKAGEKVILDPTR